MAEFGSFSGYESSVFAIPVAPHAVPLSLHFEMSESEERDFVLVPVGDTVQEFAGAFDNFTHSAMLGASFHYLGGLRTSVRLGAVQPSGRSREIRVAVLRWARRSRSPLPELVHSLQHVELGHDGRDLREIVSIGPATDPVRRADR